MSAHSQWLRRAGGQGAWLSIGLFAVFLGLFIALRSNNFMAVDGALRAMPIFYRLPFELHGNNHLIYPVWVLAWSNALSSFGLRPAGGLEFLHATQALNALLGAASLALLSRMLWLWSGSLGAALLAPVLLGVSRAFLLHATNSAEPMPGFFCSVLAAAIGIEGLQRGRSWPCFLGGAVFGLAMASYQSMVLAAPIVAVLWATWPSLTQASCAQAMARMARTMAGGFVGIVLVYGAAYGYQGIPPFKMFARFIAVGGGADVYGGLKASHVANLPFGLLRNTLGAVPEGYAGVRSLLVRPDRVYWIAAAAGGLLIVFMLTALCFRAAVRPSQRTRWQKANLVLVGVAVLPVTLPLVYWDPMYDKFWLQPIALMACGLAAAASRPRHGMPRRMFFAGALLFVVLEASSSLSAGLRDRLRPTPHLSSAAAVASMVQSTDSVVLDFDPVSSLYLAFWGHGSRTLLLPASTLPEATEWLAESQGLIARGRGLFFLGVLDLTPDAWDPFLGKRVGIPYSIFDAERREARVVRSFVVDGHILTLRSISPYEDARGARGARSGLLEEASALSEPQRRTETKDTDTE